jgi:hypothetical protein
MGAMSERKFDRTSDSRDEPDRDVERRSRPSATLEDQLQTTRLPAITPPPIGIGYSSAPPSAVIAVAPRTPSFEPGAGDSMAPSGAPSSAPAIPASPPSTPSLWRGLLTATFPPARTDGISADERLLRRRTGSAAAVLALVLLVGSLVIGLRSPPALDAPVAAAWVVSRSAVALGVLGVTIALLRIAERLFFVPIETAAADSSDAARSRDANRPPASH